MKNKNLKISGLLLAGVIVVVSFVYAINVQPIVLGDSSLIPSTAVNAESYSYDLMSFSSYDEFTNFLNNCSSTRSKGHYYWGDEVVMDMNIVPLSSKTFGAGAPKIITAYSEGESDGKVDFSTTNIQVEGVDEPDMVKTDGKFLYLVSNQKVYIIKAWPAEDAEIVATISVDFSINNIFINGNRLVIFGNQYRIYSKSRYVSLDEEEPERCMPNPWYSSSNTFIKVYDVTNKDTPILKRDVVVGGNYFNARMIGDHVYIITTQTNYDIYPCREDDKTIIPLISINGDVKEIPINHISCIDVPSYGYTLTHVISVNVIDDDEEVVDKIFTLSNGQTMYVSRNNIYISYQTSRSDDRIMLEIIDEVVMPILPDKIKLDILHAKSFDISDHNKRQIVDWILEGFYKTIDEEIKNNIDIEIQKRIHRTVIHKISVDKGKIEYLCNGTVPGRVLNQFSMDEHNGFFRIATQVNGYWKSNTQKTTNVYILDENLDRVGAVENIAPGENLHSARFMGNKAYLVTFKKVDPFFTLDLSNPYNPIVLGKLKIPGYSDYLHPYDENHIIGFGKDTVEALDSSKESRGLDFAWYQGIKIALFDVSDFDNPKEVAKIVIGDRGTNTPVLNNHKALLFDRERELLVLPVSLYEISDEVKEQSDGYTGNTQGQFKFQGAFVYRLSLENGFEYRGRITHRDTVENEETDDYWYWGSSSKDVTRSLFIDDVLYTISDSMVKMNSLGDLSEINGVKLE